MQVDRRGRNLGMVQVFTSGRDLGTTVQCMGRVGMAHRVGRGLAPLVCQLRIVGVHQFYGLLGKTTIRLRNRVSVVPVATHCRKVPI